MDRLTRRRVLGTLAGTVAMGTLAGCSGGENDSTGNDGEDSEGGGTGDSEDGKDDGEDGGTESATPQEETVLVGPDTQNVFEPDSLEIPAGTRVRFVWESSGHSLLVDSQPDGAEWEGVEETQSEGYEHSHTFDVSGTYEYYCDVHQGFGMEGSITVTEQ